MASKNPYDCNNYPGKFQIDYVGQEEGFYVLKVRLTGHKGLDGHMFAEEMSQWLMQTATSKFHMGRMMNGRCGTPVLTLARPTDDDVFVVIKSIVDLVLFEQKFEVMGITPAKLAI